MWSRRAAIGLLVLVLVTAAWLTVVHPLLLLVVLAARPVRAAGVAYPAYGGVFLVVGGTYAAITGSGVDMRVFGRAEPAGPRTAKGHSTKE